MEISSDGIIICDQEIKYPYASYSKLISHIEAGFNDPIRFIECSRPIEVLPLDKVDMEYFPKQRWLLLESFLNRLGANIESVYFSLIEDPHYRIFAEIKTQIDIKGEREDSIIDRLWSSSVLEHPHVASFRFDIIVHTSSINGYQRNGWGS